MPARLRHGWPDDIPPWIVHDLEDLARLELAGEPVPDAYVCGYPRETVDGKTYPVTFVWTPLAREREVRSRLARRHRASRPDGWPA